MDDLERSALAALLSAWQLPATDADRFVLRERAIDALGRTRVTFDQASGGYLIFGYEVNVHLDPSGDLIAITGLQADVPDLAWAPPRLGVAAAARAAGLEQGSLLVMSEVPVIFVTDVGADLVYPFERYDGLRRTFMLLSVDDGRVVDIIEGTYTGSHVAAY
jgi:fungalysin/thermolysin propeptide